MLQGHGGSDIESQDEFCEQEARRPNSEAAVFTSARPPAGDAALDGKAQGPRKPEAQLSRDLGPSRQEARRPGSPGTLDPAGPRCRFQVCCRWPRPWLCGSPVPGSVEDTGCCGHGDPVRPQLAPCSPVRGQHHGAALLNFLGDRFPQEPL